MKVPESLGSTRTSLQLFRDCLRLSQHMAGKNSPKALKIKTIIRGEFKKSKNEIDPVKIESLKGNAIRALASYLMMESSAKDDRFKKIADDFTRKEISEMDQSKR